MPIIYDTNPFKRSPQWWLVFWVLILSLLTLRVYMGDNTNTKPKAQSGMVVAYYENDYQKYAVEQLMKRQQIQEWYCLWSLWTAESHWRNKAHNKQSGAYGIAQLLPRTWNNIKFKRTSNGYRQIDAGLKYIDRHWGGSPCRAYASELARGWY